MQGLSLHYYTVPTGVWADKGSATDFGTDLWYSCFAQARRMDEMIARHSGVMDRYDPERRVALVVDEWGTWHNLEPGSRPGFLRQQNTLRDALVASIHFDIFHKHCERVRIANIAQTVNVLQAMILTDGPKLVLTPTYHAFEMSRVHQDSQRLPVFLESETRHVNGTALPLLSASASRDATGRIHVSLTNLDESREHALPVEIHGTSAAKVSGRILTAPAMNALNSFDKPATVQPAAFSGFTAHAAGRLTVKLPPKSFVVLSMG